MNLLTAALFRLFNPHHFEQIKNAEQVAPSGIFALLQFHIIIPGSVLSTAKFSDPSDRLLQQIFRAEQLNAVLNHLFIIVRRNSGGHPICIGTFCILPKSIQITSVAQFNVVCRITGIRSNAEICEFTGMQLLMKLPRCQQKRCG